VAKREFSTIDEIERLSCGCSACSVVNILNELRQYFFGIRTRHSLLLKLRVKVEIKLRRFQASTLVLLSSFSCDVARRRERGVGDQPTAHRVASQKNEALEMCPFFMCNIVRQSDVFYRLLPVRYKCRIHWNFWQLFDALYLPVRVTRFDVCLRHPHISKRRTTAGRRRRIIKQLSVRVCAWQVQDSNVIGNTVKESE